MTGVSLNPASAAIGANPIQSDIGLNQQTGLDALLASPSFTFEGSSGLGDQLGTGLRDVGTVIGNNGPGDPRLGTMPWVPDRMENWVDGRTILSNGNAYEVSNGIYTFYNKWGDVIGKFKITTDKDKGFPLEIKSKSETTIGFGPVKNTTSNETNITVYLTPVK
jgi:hypothetical protein